MQPNEEQTPPKPIVVAPVIAEATSQTQVIANRSTNVSSSPVGSAIDTSALIQYEAQRIQHTTWGVIKNDPSLKKQFIISVVLILSLFLGLIGIVMLLMVLTKAGKIAKSDVATDEISMLQQFAEKNKFAVANQVANQDSLLAQSRSSSNSKALPAVQGNLPAGHAFNLEIASRVVSADAGGSPEQLGINTAMHNLNVAGAQVGVGSVFTSTAGAVSTLHNVQNDTVFFHVTVDEESFGSSNTIINGEYVILRIGINLGTVTVPHVVLQPKQAIAVPFATKEASQLTTEGNFNDYFAILYPKGYETETLQILEPDTMQRFMQDFSDITIEFTGNEINIMSVVRPYANPQTLAAVASSLYAKAVQLEPWLTKRFTAWSFQPQQAPYVLHFKKWDPLLVAQHVNMVGNTHVDWERTRNDDS